jgi:dTDP-4-dehydrorhamnose reductase
MKILVTGTQGQLSRSLLERSAYHEGMSLSAVGRPQLDLVDFAAVHSVITAAAPDVVINAAAYTAVDLAEDESELAFKVNGEAAGEVAAAARAVGARIIQISTDYVFDGRAIQPYAVDAKPNPKSIYGKSKLEGEERVRAAAPADHVIVRTGWVYSPFGRNFVKTMMNLAKSRNSIAVVSDQRGNPSSAVDLAEGLLCLIEIWQQGQNVGLGETYHLAGTGSTNWCAFAEAIFSECERIGAPFAKVVPIDTANYPTKADRPANSMLESSRFETEIGYGMPDWRISLGPVVERLALEISV